MKVTRDVITDVWPVYEAGEASADTRALVEEFLREDPEFARLVHEERSLKMLSAASPVLSPDHEKATLAQTKQLMRYRDLTLVLALVLTMAAGMLRQYRPLTLALAAVALGSWLALWRVTQRLRVKGL